MWKREGISEKKREIFTTSFQCVQHVQPGRPNPTIAIWSVDLPKDGSNHDGGPFSKGLIPVPEEFRQKLVNAAYKFNFGWLTDLGHEIGIYLTITEACVDFSYYIALFRTRLRGVGLTFWFWTCLIHTGWTHQSHGIAFGD